MAKRQEASTDTSAFYMELSKLEKNQEFDKALKICNKILNVTPKDDMAFQCKMVNSLIICSPYFTSRFQTRFIEYQSTSMTYLLNMLRNITLHFLISNRYKCEAKATNSESFCT